MVLKAFFFNYSAALAVRVALGASYNCSQPLMATPRQGRPWLLTIRIPSSFLVGGKPNPRVLDRIIMVVQQYRGRVIDDQPGEIE